MSDESEHPEAADGDTSRPEWRNFYGRIRGKTMRASQKTYLSEDLDSLRPRGITRAENPAREVIDPATIFGNDAPIWLEVGFGGGEHLVHMAASHPQVNIIGAEPFINGVAMLLGKIRAADVTNLAVHPGDARDLMDVLPEGCIAKAFLNYPDPWPKRRHHRRRFVTAEHLVPLARVMAPGAELRVATDIPGYVEHTREAIAAVPELFETVARDTAAPWSDWHRTRYEAKAIREGRAPNYLSFLRRG